MRGRDIKRDGYKFAGLYLITAHNGYVKDDGTTVPRIEIENYPAIKKWLESEKWNNKPDKGTSIERLSNRTDKGETPYNLRDCAYMDDFDGQKILYSEIVKSPQFYLDDEKFIPEATTFLMSGEHLDALIKYMNSNIVAWIFKTYYAGGGLGENGYRYKKAFLVNLPIPRYFDAESINDEKICQLYNFTDEEIYFISSSVK